MVGLGCGPGGSEPSLQSIADQVVAVNQEVVIVLSASDADGDEVFYAFESEVPNIYSRASLSRLPIGVGEFRWTPQAADVGVWFFDFIAFDGQGADTVTVRIEVKSALGANSIPRFLHPLGSGTTLDLSQQRCLTLNVEVIDEDSAEVVLAQENPKIEGAQLTPVSGLAAQWTWCPTNAQIEADDRYTLLLSADDGEHDKTLHPYLIVLRRPLKPDCPGAAPVVVHTPADIDSLLNISIQASVSDDLGLKREPLLYYSTTSSEANLAEMTQVTMALEEGDMQSGTWGASIPNPVVGQPTGSVVPLYYLIVANDDDDSQGDCDHRTQAPTDGSFSMSVSNPGGFGGAGVCESCIADLQCGGLADLCVVLGDSADAVCLRDCGSSCDVGYECSTDELQSIDGLVSRQCVPSSGSCSDESVACLDDELEDNDSRQEAQANALLAEGTHNLVSCPVLGGVNDDEDWFEVFLSQDGLLSVELNGGSSSDLDLAVYDAGGVLMAASTGLTATESVAPCLSQGFYLVRVYALQATENTYSLSYQTSAMTCPIDSCEADAGEEDDSADAAREADIGSGAFESLDQTSCPYDDDWYRFTLVDGQVVQVDLVFEQVESVGDLDIHIFDAASNDLTPCSPADVSGCDTSNGQSGNSDESMQFQAPASGCESGCTYYAVVRGFDGDKNGYDIHIATLP